MHDVVITQLRENPAEVSCTAQPLSARDATRALATPHSSRIIFASSHDEDKESML
jgi:hypothetical protein